MEWRFDDWHSPFVIVLWSMLLHLLPGPVGFVVFANALIWTALSLLALALRRRIGLAAVLVVAVPVFPGAFNFLGNVHVDVLLVAWLLAAFSTAYLSRLDNCSPSMRIGLQILANLLVVAAFLTRLNAIFALVPLLLYANARLGVRRNVLLCLVLMAIMPLLYKAQNALLDVPTRTPSDSIKVYNLLALSYYERRNLLPGAWSEQQSLDIVNACYTPVQWDTAWYGECHFIADELMRQEVWGSSRLTRVWLKEIISHPAGYFTLLAATFKRSMFEPNSRAMLYHTPNRWHWAVADSPPRPSTELAQKYIRSEFNDQIGRPWIYALLSALGIVLLYRTRVVDTDEGCLALALHASGLVYLLTYFVFNVSAEYRYFYWCGFAAYLGLLVTLFVVLRSHAMRGRSVSAVWLRLPVLGGAALAVALVLFPYHHPTERRVVTITPLGAGPVVVAGVHHASTPKWMLANFEGSIEPMAWRWEAGKYHSTHANSPLVIGLDSLKQDISVVLMTGPGMGTVVIDAAGFHRQVETAAEQTGVIVVGLPPQSTEIHAWLGVSLRNASFALLFFLAALALFHKLSIPGVPKYEISHA